MVHNVAAAGFNDPGDYEAARPSYPPEAVAWFVEHLRLDAGNPRVADLAAGTGKLTRLLAPGVGAGLIAVEPVAGMRATFARLLPEIPVVAATAEALPFAGVCARRDRPSRRRGTGSTTTRAAAEAARVLRPGGRLGLVWNARDRSEPWVDKVWSIMDRVEKRAPWRDHENWSDSAMREMPGFGELHMAEFRHRQDITPEGVVQRVASVSHVAVLPEPEKQAVLAEVRAVLETDPAVAGRASVAIPYRVDCFWAERQ